MAKFKEVNGVHPPPQRLLKNLNISILGSRNSVQKTWNNARKRGGKGQRATGTEWEGRSQLGFPKFAEFIYFLAAVVSYLR